MASYDIFISYRRFDSSGVTSGTNIARSIKQQLEIEGYCDRVFFDYSEITDGEFEKTILPAIEASKVFLLILSKEALQRCANEDDWVRREVLHAIRNNIKIVPINPDYQFDGYPMGFPEEMNVIRKIQHQCIHLDSSFEHDVKLMIENRIAPVTPPSASLADVLETNLAAAVIHVETDLDCDIFSFGNKIGTAKANEYQILHLKKGKHKLEFRSIENPTDRYTMVYEVQDNDMENFISIVLKPTRDKRVEQEHKALLLAERKERLRKGKNLRFSRKAVVIVLSLAGIICLAGVAFTLISKRPADDSTMAETTVQEKTMSALEYYEKGLHYENGTGVAVNPEEAFKCYSIAAELGLADAQSSLAYCYGQGFGVQQDYEKAVQWYLRAAEQGHATSQYNLGICYSKGRGVEKDDVEAAKWYEKVAEQGFSTAQYILGACYEGGIGVQKDLQRAVEWYRKAAEQNEENAVKALSRLGL